MDQRQGFKGLRWGDTPRRSGKSTQNRLGDSQDVSSRLLICDQFVA